jgi:hypothetical protein
MRIHAELRAFAEIAGEYSKRPIDIPDNEAQGKDTQALLDLAFKYGQNDFQPREYYSVSAGDVIVLNDGSKWMCKSVGWEPFDPTATYNMFGEKQ